MKLQFNVEQFVIRNCAFALSLLMQLSNMLLYCCYQACLVPVSAQLYRKVPQCSTKPIQDRFIQSVVKNISLILNKNENLG